MCLIALALYAAGEQQRVYEVHRVAMRPALDLLNDDQQARQVAVLQPGLEGWPGCGLHNYDRTALAEAVQPGGESQWRQWRDTAVQVLSTNMQDCWSAAPPPGPRLQDRLSQVRSMNVRRGWYDQPDLPPMAASDEDPSARL